MKEKIILRVISIIVIICGLVLVIFGLYHLFKQLSSDEKELVDCFDKYGNKIIGATCEERGQEYGTIAGLGIFLVGVGIFLSMPYPSI